MCSVRVGVARAPDGAELELFDAGGIFTLRADGYELMTTREHRSEDALALETLRGFDRHPAPRVLIGGLGFGFTARAALRVLPKGAEVVVAELSPEVIAWNRGPLAVLWPEPDERLRIVHSDVAQLLEPGSYDAILLDIDNGPSPLVRPTNAWIYTEEGLGHLRSSLRGQGVLGVWSAVEDASFEARMLRHFFLEPVRIELGSVVHTLFLGRPRDA